MSLPVILPKNNDPGQVDKSMVLTTRYHDQEANGKMIWKQDVKHEVVSDDEEQ